MGISLYRVAKNIHVPQRRIDLICRGEAAVSADMALRLGHLFGTTPELWINLQAQYDLEVAARAAGKAIARTVVPLADQPEDKVIECLAHLIALPGITVEDRDEIDAALNHCRKGIDFAHALHLAASRACSELRTFDDRGYARRARNLRLKPPVRVPTR